MMDPASEAALVAAGGAGDAPTGDTLLQGHLAEVRRWLALRCRDQDLAEELAQEVAARASLRSGRLNPRRNVGGYLIRMAQNVWRDWLRHELVRRRATAGLTDEVTRPALADAELMQDEIREALRLAIAALPPAERDVVSLRHQGDHTFQQIADRLGRPLGTVLGQMRSALRRMHDIMEAYR